MSVSVDSLSFGDSSPEEKLRLGKTIGKVIGVAGKVLPVASQFVPALVPVNVAVQAGKQIAQVLKK
jgi:hypothetical protein